MAWKYYDYKCKSCDHVEERLVNDIDEPQRCSAIVGRTEEPCSGDICCGEMERWHPAVHVTPEWQIPSGR